MSTKAGHSVFNGGHWSWTKMKGLLIKARYAVLKELLFMRTMLIVETMNDGCM
jgi:hypothetical protein